MAKKNLAFSNRSCNIPVRPISTPSCSPCCGKPSATFSLQQSRCTIYDGTRQTEYQIHVREGRVDKSLHQNYPALKLWHSKSTKHYMATAPPPPYMKDMFTSRQEEKHSLRNEHQLNIPFSRTVGFGSHSIQFEGERVWNHLPNKIRCAENLASLKTLLRTWGGCHCAICTSYF